MNKRDINKMRMYNQVVLIISEHSSIWQANVPFTEAYSTFSQGVIGLKEFVNSQFALKGKLSIHKREMKEELTEVALRIQRVIVFYAAKSEQLTLLESVKRTPSFWRRTTETNRLSQAERLSSLLEEHLPALQDFGLEQSDLDELNAKINAYTEALSGPRSAIVHRGQFTASIDTSISELDDLLKLQMDTFVKSLTVTHPDFVSLFLRARNIVNYKGSSGHIDSAQDEGSGLIDDESESGGADE
ncbi:MAG: hypothetical protein QNK23_16305 [Crocinitomicaceae bacterium]|nr:hypothetical protein [Crocinitomicaceae bacterium]